MNENPLFWDEDDDPFEAFINAELDETPIDDPIVLRERLEPWLRQVIDDLKYLVEPGPYYTALMTPRQQVLHALLAEQLDDRFRGNQGLWLSRDVLIREVIALAWIALLQIDDTIVRKNEDE